MASDARDSSGFELVEITEHAAVRWHERMASRPNVGPVVAWNEGTTLPQPHGLHCDEARYHEPTDLVLVAGADVRERRAIVTVIRGATAKPTLSRAIEEVSD